MADLAFPLSKPLLTWKDSQFPNPQHDLLAPWNISLKIGTSKHLIPSLLVVKSRQGELVSMRTQFKSMPSVFHHSMNIKSSQLFANDYSIFDFKNIRLS